jgi:hypothetical protein
MKMQGVLVVLTAANLGLLVNQLVQPNRTAAQEIAPVLRGRELQLIDQRGRVRVEMKVFPPDPTVKMPDGSTGYPETVLLRLIDSRGRPNVKIAATEDGSAISLGGNANPTDIQILSRGDKTLLKLVNRDNKQKLIAP